MKTLDNITSQIRKGCLDFIILSALKKHPKYPREIIEELKRNGMNIVEGTIYPLFLRLYKNNLVKYEWIEASGHPRKYYSLTEQGQIALEKYMEEWERLTSVLHTMIEGN